MSDNRRAVDDGSTPESDAAVLTARLGELLALEVDQFFRNWGLTLLQFNVLRILYVRDPSGAGVPRETVEARLIKRVPDVTRLMDRLEEAGMIERFRRKVDRRKVMARLTPKGAALVEETHADLLALNRRQFAHLSRDEVLRLTELVRKAAGRERIDSGIGATPEKDPRP